MTENNLDRILGDSNVNDDGLWPKTDAMRAVFGWTLGVVVAAGMLYGIHAAHKREYAAMSQSQREAYDRREARGPLIMWDIAKEFLYNWGDIPRHQRK